MGFGMWQCRVLKYLYLARCFDYAMNLAKLYYLCL